MDVILYFGALIICALPIFFKGISFIDIIPLFLFYFDATFVFVNHEPSYQYFQSAIFLFFSLKTITEYLNKGQTNNFGVFLYIMSALLIFPIFQGETVEKTLRSFSVSFVSLIMLPISFFHYYNTGNIQNLLKATFVMMLLYVLYILMATPFQLGGTESERYGGKVFYFGHLAARGGITYIAFALLLAPLIIETLKYWQKVLLVIVIIFIMIIFLTVLKRFVFAVIGLGVLNYILRPIVKPVYKIRIALIAAVVLGIVLTQDGFTKIISERYDQRGGESKFSQDNVTSDLRFYEPYYVVQAVLAKPTLNVLVGKKNENIFDIKREDTVYEERKIHNSYANILLSFGFFGLVLYIAIYYRLYSQARIYYRNLKKIDYKKILPYWIVFQNMLVIFILQGLIGGHERVTLRGLVFLYAGALAGYMGFQYKKQKEFKKYGATKQG